MAKVRIQDKIKSIDEIQKIIGTFPRKRSVVLSHGIFDILHPGHLQHLLYAKEQADIQVACLTADQFIKNATPTPYISESQRATNLAVLECVDFVLIDNNPSPVEAILRLKPNIFAKGYESSESEQTLLERQAVASYGGEVLMTPGNIPSVAFASPDSAKVKVSTAKLLVLMKAEGITFEQVRTALSNAKELNIHIVGDAIVEGTIHTSPTGGVTKSPTVSLVVQKETFSVGGAAMVALHFAAAGAKVTLSTVLGNDTHRDVVLGSLKEYGVQCTPIIDEARPTPLRSTYIAQEHHLLRTNSFDNRTISEKVVVDLCKSLSQTPADGCVFCDSRLGIFAKDTIPKLIAATPKSAFKAVDSHVASRWGNVLEFQNFDLIAPNEREARFALGDQDSTVRPLALELYNQAKCKLLLLKLGERGILAYKASSHDPKSFFTIGSFAEQVIDAASPGDAFLAYATVGNITSKSEVIAALLGSFASAVALERRGNTPVYASDVMEKINAIEAIARSADILSFSEESSG